MPHPSKEPDDSADLDQRVLTLRRGGKSFASIARALKLDRARDANAAFLRAVHCAKPAERTRLCDEELGRLQKLEDGIKARADLSPFDRDKQLDVVKYLRKLLLTS